MANGILIMALERRFYEEGGSWCRAEEKVRELISELEKEGNCIEDGLLKELNRGY